MKAKKVHQHSTSEHVRFMNCIVWKRKMKPASVLVNIKQQSLFYAHKVGCFFLASGPVDPIPIQFEIREHELPQTYQPLSHFYQHEVIVPRSTWIPPDFLTSNTGSCPKLLGVITFYIIQSNHLFFFLEWLRRLQSQCLVSQWCSSHLKADCWNRRSARDSCVIFWMDDSQRVPLGLSRHACNCVVYT